MTRKVAISRTTFRREVDAWAARIGVSPRRVQLRELRRFWASCSPAGTITFDPDLLRESKRFRSSVIVHELMHMIVPNHGKLFTALNKTYLGNAAISTPGQAASCRYEK
ncbi:MAG: M48 metallopeptidase family protein [Thermoanaerobaculia bacterium]